MFKRHLVTTPPPLMRVRRDTSTHLQPSPWQRRRSNERLHGNDDNDMPPITTNLDDMIEALDHDITHIGLDPSASSGDTEATDTNADSRSVGSSPFSLQLSLLS